MLAARRLAGIGTWFADFKMVESREENVQKSGDTEQGRPAEKQGIAFEAEKVVCFVCKKEVDKGSAKQIKHPKEGLVWVSEQYIK